MSKQAAEHRSLYKTDAQISNHCPPSPHYTTFLGPQPWTGHMQHILQSSPPLYFVCRKVFPIYFTRTKRDKQDKTRKQDMTDTAITANNHTCTPNTASVVQQYWALSRATITHGSTFLFETIHDNTRTCIKRSTSWTGQKWHPKTFQRHGFPPF